MRLNEIEDFEPHLAPFPRGTFEKDDFNAKSLNRGEILRYEVGIVPYGYDFFMKYNIKTLGVLAPQGLCFYLQLFFIAP